MFGFAKTTCYLSSNWPLEFAPHRLKPNAGGKFWRLSHAAARHLLNHLLETQCGLLQLLEGSHATFFLLPKTSKELLFLFSILADRVLDLGKDPSLLAQFFLLMRQFCFDILLIG